MITQKTVLDSSTISESERHDEDTWAVVSAETQFGPVRGLVVGDSLGYCTAKAGSMDEFLSWAQRWLGDAAQLHMAEQDSTPTQVFQNDIDQLLQGHAARLQPDLSRNTQFQKQVAETVLQIPYGETASYGEIALALGKPGGAQAVGQALPKLPFALYIPTHRVVRSNSIPIGCTLLTFEQKTGLLQWERERAGKG